MSYESSDWLSEIFRKELTKTGFRRLYLWPVGILFMAGEESET
jgi:hypothetical protein